MHEVFVILHDVRSVHNVGSVFRTADAAGVSKLYLTGHTATPIDRFGRKRADMHKVALGAEEMVLWEYTDDILSLVDHLRSRGVRVVAVEQDERAKPYTAARYNGPTGFLFGNEVEGIPVEVRDRADTHIEIPMYGAKESLNVSVAAGIILFHHRSQGDISV
jgi:tRNA G18 (ribose-2'-O)-methylase SpoU